MKSTNRIKNISSTRINILRSEPKPTVQRISKCLDQVKAEWNKKGDTLARLWNEWNEIIDEPLSSNCKPISLTRGVLTIGASQPQWLQALQYNRNQMMAMLQAHKYEIKEIRIKRSYPTRIISELESEQKIWERHPSRVDIHGMSECSFCQSPSPSGELSLWGKCGSCRRKELSIN